MPEHEGCRIDGDTGDCIDRDCHAEARGNGRSWRWTRRARILGWTLLMAGAIAAGFFSYLLPWVRNP